MERVGSVTSRSAVKALNATSPTQVIEFLNNPDGKCVLFPDGHMGPDLSWFFQDWETKELIFANVEGKLLETLTPAK